MTAESVRGRKRPGEGRGTRQRERGEAKLERLLSVAASLMARSGYDQTTIRDVGRETGYSLAGMYYYFKGKDDLLFQIQQRTFAMLLEEQTACLQNGGAPEDELRLLIRNHVSFFTRFSNELKVCTFELESLSGEQYEEIEALRRSYFRLVSGVVRDLLGERATRTLPVRHHTLFVFGMLNWLVLWFDKRRDGPVDRLADEMTDLVLHGLPTPRSGTGRGEESGTG